MERKRGYLVVSADPSAGCSANPAYQGLYRTPPFDQQQYNAGFDDPYLSDELIDESGLIPNIVMAEEVGKRFASVMPREHVELLWVTTDTDEHNDEKPPFGAEWLGYDVACEAPFWSVVADPVPGLPQLRLNAHGLLDRREDAERLRAAFAGTPSGPGTELLIWEVWRVAEWQVPPT